MKIALISCSKMKRDHSCTAAELYSPSHLFSLSYAYAQKVADKVFILSAKYGLVEEEDVISPYNLTLNHFSKQMRKEWGQKVLKQLKEKCILDEDAFIILTGKNYYEELLPHLTHNTIPLGNLSLGQRLSKLTSLLSAENKPTVMVKKELEW